MHYVQFKILEVNCGWIYAAIETEEEQIYIDNSYLGGLQMPGMFLKSITELLSRKEQEKWICWHGQSNSYILEQTANVIVAMHMQRAAYGVSPHMYHLLTASHI